MIINIYSYEEAVKSLSNHKKNWISIRDLGYSNIYNELDKYAENILEIYFDDVTDQNIKTNTLHPFYQRAYMKRGLVCFDEEMAKKIIKFSEDVYNNGEELNIHCWAGRSRSQAIGYCLNFYYNYFLKVNNSDFLYNLNNSIDKFIGNYDVTRVLTKELYKK